MFQLRRRLGHGHRRLLGLDVRRSRVVWLLVGECGRVRSVVLVGDEWAELAHEGRRSGRRRHGVLAMEVEQASLVEIELLPRDEQVPVDNAHVEALELVDVVQRDAADGCDELVSEVNVVEHLACQ